MKKWIVTWNLIPTNYNTPSSLVIEAAGEKDAIQIAKYHIGDLGKGTQFSGRYVYEVRPYALPPIGSVIERI